MEVLKKCLRRNEHSYIWVFMQAGVHQRSPLYKSFENEKMLTSHSDPKWDESPVRK